MDLFRCLYQVIPYDKIGAEIALDLWWAKVFICLCMLTGQSTTAVTIVQLLVPMVLLFPGTATTMR